MGVLDIFKPKFKCQKYFTTETRTINITGLTTTLKGKAGADLINIGAGQIEIKPEYMEATNKLKELDALQFSICQSIQQLADNSPQRDALLTELVKAQIDMLRIAQNPDALKKKARTTRS